MSINSYASTASIAHLVFPAPVGTNRQRADAAVLAGVLQKQNPDIVPLLHRLLTSGSELARLKLRESLAENLSFRSYNKQDRPDWAKRYARLQNMLAHNSYLDWNFHNVVAEAGREWNIREDEKAFDFTRMMFAHVYPAPTTMDVNSDFYWRGAVAYAMVRFTHDYTPEAEADGDLMKFVDFSGSPSTDIKLVIEAALSLNSINLERLMNALLEGTSPALRAGAL